MYLSTLKQGICHSKLELQYTMNHIANALENNILEEYKDRAPQHVINAIQKASSASGVDFTYLMQQADAESSFNTTAKARTSSASGLYQFIDRTWISMIERYGDDYGIDTSDMDRSEILALRKDAQTSSFMAAAFASENERSLNRNWGGEVGATELYLAHFMGASGASSFLKARDENPIRPAADLFPRAARANYNVFYDKTGDARTMEEVYQFFDKKFTPTECDANPDLQSVIKAQTENCDDPAAENALIAHQTSNSSLFRANTDHPVMQRAQAMRIIREQESQTVSGYNSLADAYLNQPFSDYKTKSSLISDLVLSKFDLMMMTQNVTNESSLVKQGS